MESIVGESKYCKGFDYTAMTKRIDLLRKELLELKFSEPESTFRIPIDMIRPEKKLFVDRFEFVRKPERAEMKMKSRLRKFSKSSSMEENNDPNASQFFSNLMLDINANKSPYSQTNRPFVRQNRSRPPYLEQYINEMHANQKPRPEFDAIDEPVRVQCRGPKPAPDRATDSICVRSDAAIQSERFECDQATITESVCDRIDSATSPPPAFIQAEPTDDKSVIVPVPFSILDLEPIDDIPAAYEFVSRSEPSIAVNPVNSSSLDINDDSLFALVLQMFSAATLTEYSQGTDRDNLSGTKAPLVTVSIDVITSVINDSELTFSRLSIEVLNTDTKYIISAESHFSRTEAISVYGSEQECDVDDAQTSESYLNRDDAISLDVKTESGDQLLSFVPLSPRSRQNNARRSIVSRGVEFRLSSPNRSVGEVEVVQVEESEPNVGIQIEEYQEDEIRNDALAESQLVQPSAPTQKDIVEVIIISSPENSDVSVAIKIIEAPSVCIGPRLLKSSTNIIPIADPDQSLITEESIRLDELECDTGLAVSESASQDVVVETHSQENMAIFSYIQSSNSDSSNFSEDSDSSSTTGTDNNSVRIGFSSVFSSGEVAMPSYKDDYSDGEIIPSMLLNNRSLLGYLSDSTDTESVA